MKQAPTFAPLLVLTIPQIVTRWDLTAEELAELLAMLRNRERKLTSGKPAYFLSDVEHAVETIRRGHGS